MRYALKITTTFALALVFSAGMAFGQSFDHEADINQVGDDNSADVLQKSSGSASEASVEQGGDENTATLEQIEYGLGGHFADIEQSGTENLVNARTQGHKHELRVDQSGTRNEAGVQSLNLGDDIGIEQSGIANFADVYLWTGGNDATVFQDGNKNNASISYEGTNDTDHEGMNLRVYQDGNLNEGDILVDGDGTGGTADIVQFGSNNMGTIEQFDGVHSAEIRQDGAGNTATVTQQF